MAEARILIKDDEILQPGDIIEAHFDTISGTWLTAVELYFIEKKIEDDGRWEIISISQPNDYQVVYRVRVKPQAMTVQQAGLAVYLTSAIFTALVMRAIFVLGVAVVYKIVNTEAVKSIAKGFENMTAVPAKIAESGIGQIALVAAAVWLGWIYLRKT